MIYIFYLFYDFHRNIIRNITKVFYSFDKGIQFFLCLFWKIWEKNEKDYITQKALSQN